MATIGALGEIAFYVSRNEIKTLKDIKRSAGATYAKHDIVGGKPLSEFTGLEAETITFQVELSIFLGTTPVDAYNQMLYAMREAKVMKLVIGDELIGDNSWVIIKLDSSINNTDGRGNITSCSVSVTLQEYL